MRVSADGQRVAFDTLAMDWDLQGEAPSRLALTYGAYLVDTDGGSLVTVERTDCVEIESEQGATGCEALNNIIGLSASWDHDARNVTLAFPEWDGDGAQTRVRRLTAAGGPTGSATVPDPLLYSLQTSGDDGLQASLELSLSGPDVVTAEDCYLAWRAVADRKSVV